MRCSFHLDPNGKVNDHPFWSVVSNEGSPDRMQDVPIGHVGWVDSESAYVFRPSEPEGSCFVILTTVEMQEIIDFIAFIQGTDS